MLDLQDERWATLPNAYHDPDLPALLVRLTTEPPDADDSAASGPEQPEPTLWETIWNLVYHQGTIYPASIAAFPYLVSAAARAEPAKRAHWLNDLAELEATRVIGELDDPHQLVDAALMQAYQAALVHAASLACEALTTQAEWSGRERSAAAMMSLLAFARGDQRLGFLLARWWPYGECSASGGYIPVTALATFEEFTGQRQNPLEYDAAE